MSIIRNKRTQNLDRLLAAVLAGDLSIEAALQDAACRQDAALARLLREEVSAARLLHAHPARMVPVPASILHGRQRLEAKIRSQHASWRGIFWLKRLDWAASIAMIVVLLFAGFAQIIGQTRHAVAIAIPGDRLYFLKIAAEELRLNLAQKPEDRARLYLEFAHNRSLELESLILENQAALLPQTLAGLESALGRAQQIQEQVPGELPDDIRLQMAEMERTVLRQLALVNFYADPLPASLRPGIEQIAWLAFNSMEGKSMP